MQADGRLVEHVEHARGAVAHGTAQLRALSFARGKRRARAVERQIPQAKLAQTLHRLAHVFHDGPCHGTQLFGHAFRDAPHPPNKFIERQRARLREIDATHERSTSRIRKARAAAGLAGHLAQILGNALEPLLVLHLREGVLHRGAGGIVGEVHLAGRAGLLVVIKQVVLVWRAVKHELLLVGRKVLVRHVRADSRLTRDVLHERPHEMAPRGNGTLVDGLALIGDERGLVYGTLRPRARARGTRTVRVECQHLRTGAIELNTALRTCNRLLKRHVHAWRHVMAVWTHVAPQTAEEQTKMVQQFRGRAKRRAHAGDSGTLSQGKRRGHMQDLVHIGAARLADATPRIRRERLHVAARPLGIEHAQREARFA